METLALVYIVFVLGDSLGTENSPKNCSKLQKVGFVRKMVLIRLLYPINLVGEIRKMQLMKSSYLTLRNIRMYQWARHTTEIKDDKVRLSIRSNIGLLPKEILHYITFFYLNLMKCERPKIFVIDVY